jgi:hypothetical protein
MSLPWHGVLAQSDDATEENNMEIRKSLRRLLGGLVLTIAAIGIVAGPASATNSGDCDYTHVCFFKNINYGGGIAEYANNDSNYDNNSYSSCSWFCQLDNSASSMFNNGQSCNTAHYVNAGYGGVPYYLGRGYYWSQIADPYHDELSAHKWCQ